MNIDLSSCRLASRAVLCRAGRSQLCRIIILFVLILSLLPVQPAVAKPGDLDPSFLEPNPTGAGPVGSSYAGSSVEQPDGKIIVGGSFWTMNGQNRDRLARFNSDGSLDKNFAAYLYFDYAIYTLALLPDGDILVGGSFRNVNGSKPANHIVRLNSDGTLDTAFQSKIDVVTTGNISSVITIVPLADGDLLVGGRFSSVGGVPRGNIARLNADGSLDAAFMDGAEETGTNNGVSAIVVQPNGKILISGQFTEINKTPRGRVARLEADGSLDNSFMYGAAGATDIVTALALLPDGRVMVGGYFANINQSNPARAYIARLDANGSVDASFQPVFGPSGSVQIRTISCLSDGDLIVSGYFTTVNDTPMGNIVRLNSNGTIDGNFLANKPGTNMYIIRSRVLSDGKILITGTFTLVNGVSRNMVARLNANGTLDSNFLMAGANNEVNAVAVQPEDGMVLAGGRFDVVNGLAQAGITRLNPDGTIDDGFWRNSGGGMSGGEAKVNAIVVQPDGGILAGGNFTKAGHRDAGNFARFDAYGNPDAYFNTAGTKGTDGEVYGIALQADGKILVVGNFQTAGETARKHIARFNADATIDTSFAAVDLNGLIYGVAVQEDGKIVIVGEFTTVNGQSRGRVARLNADGTLDAGYLNGVAGAANVVRTVGIDPQGNAIIGGWFTSVNGMPFNRIARLSKTDGSPDPVFLKDMPGPDNGIRALEVQKDGSILIGGEFFAVNETECKHIALLEPDGQLSADFTCEGAIGINGGWVNAVTNVDARVIIGGDFTQVRGAERGGVAALEGIDFTEVPPEDFSLYLPMLRR